MSWRCVLLRSRGPGGSSRHLNGSSFLQLLFKPGFFSLQPCDFAAGIARELGREAPVLYKGDDFGSRLVNVGLVSQNAEFKKESFRRVFLQKREWSG